MVRLTTAGTGDNDHARVNPLPTERKDVPSCFAARAVLLHGENIVMRDFVFDLMYAVS